jgi:hypothetical protein
MFSFLVFDSKGGGIRGPKQPKVYQIPNHSFFKKIEVHKWLFYGFSVQDRKDVVYGVRGWLKSIIPYYADSMA